MKSSLPIMLLAVTTSLVQEAVPVPSNTKIPAPCTISGQVVKKATGEPLKSARLLLIENSAGDGHHYTAFTDVTGRFTMKDIAPGRYDFQARRIGYVEQDYRPEGAHSGAILELAPGQKLDKVLFRLIAGAAVVGRITDEDGDPAPAIVIQALAEESNGQRKVLNPIARALSDDLGKYRLSGIPPGEYYFNTIDPGMPDLSPIDFIQGFRFATQNDVSNRHPSIYYPGVLRRDDAQKVNLRAGEELHLNLALRSAKSLTVAGVVLGPSGTPASGVDVYLRDRNEQESLEFGLIRNSAQTDAKGRFQINNVLPSDYLISAALQEKDKRYSAFQALDVASESIRNVQLVLKEPLSVTGRVIAQASPHFVFQSLWVIAMPVNENAGRPGSAFVQKDGSFKIELVQSTYGLNIQSLPEGWYLSSARLDGEDILQHGMKMEAAASHKLELQLSHAAARLLGTVIMGDKPAIGIHVRLAPVLENQYRGDLLKGAATDQNGHFVITGIVPGSYNVQASFDEDATREEPALGHKTAEATVELGESEARTVKLKIKEDN